MPVLLRTRVFAKSVCLKHACNWVLLEDVGQLIPGGDFTRNWNFDQDFRKRSTGPVAVLLLNAK